MRDGLRFMLEGSGEFEVAGARKDGTPRLQSPSYSNVRTVRRARPKTERETPRRVRFLTPPEGLPTPGHNAIRCGDRSRCGGRSPTTTGRTPPGTASAAPGSRREVGRSSSVMDALSRHRSFRRTAAISLLLRSTGAVRNPQAGRYAERKLTRSARPGVLGEAAALLVGGLGRPPPASSMCAGFLVALPAGGVRAGTRTPARTFLSSRRHMPSGIIRRRLGPFHAWPLTEFVDRRHTEFDGSHIDDLEVFETRRGAVGVLWGCGESRVLHLVFVQQVAAAALAG